jgi:Mce-associated membrane protein
VAGPARGRLRGVLVIVAAVLVAVVAAEAWYLLDEPSAGEHRPVVVGDLAARAVVDAAGQDITEIASTSYRNYDDQVDQATTLMTPEYAVDFRATAASLRQEFADSERETAARVVASAVVSATSTEVRALVFLDSQVSEHGSAPVTVPYRTLVTMERTGHGWLVSGIETR